MRFVQFLFFRHALERGHIMLELKIEKLESIYYMQELSEDI